MKIGDYYLYCHTFPNGKRYIGITRQTPTTRWANGLGYSKGHQPIMHRAIQKYGWDNIKHEIIKSGLDEADAFQLEIDYIRKYNTHDLRYGYNRTDGGAGTNGMEHSEKAKEKISKASLAMWQHEGFRDEMSRKHSGQNNPNYGKTISQTQRMILSECAKQRIGSLNPFYGKTHTSNTKEIISQKKKGTHIGKDNHNSKPVRCIETNQVFESASLAAKWVGASASTITNACRRGSDFLSYGYHWEYI